MAFQLTPNPKFQAFDNNGNPLTGGKVYSYLAGSTTPVDTYTDASGQTANSNPIILDSRGEANLWLSQNLVYKLVLTDSADVEIWSVDNISVASGAGGGSGADEFVKISGTDLASQYLSEKLVAGTNISLNVLNSGAVEKLEISAADANIQWGDITGTISNQTDLQAELDTLSGDIATNTSDIATNTSDIATNTSDIATNTGNIATNTSNIATNTSDIGAIQTNYVTTDTTQTISGNKTFSTPVSGVTPTASAHLATKNYVDASAVNIPTPALDGSFLVKNTNGTFTLLDGVSGPPMRWNASLGRFQWTGQLDFTGSHNYTNGSIVNFLDALGVQDAFIANQSGGAFQISSNALGATTKDLELLAGGDVYIASTNTGKRIILDTGLDPVETTHELIVGQITTGTQVGLVGYDSAGKLIQGTSSGGTQDLDSVLTQGNTTGTNKINYAAYNNSSPSLGDRWSDGQELRGYQRGNQDNDAFDQNMVGASVSLLTSQDVNKCPFGFSQIANSTATNLPNGWETSGVSNVITFGHEPNSTTISQIISSNNRVAQRSTRTGTWVEISNVNQAVTNANTGPEDNAWINGIYKMSVTTGYTNYPATFGLVHGIREGNSRHFQYFYERYSSNVYTRYQDSASNTWSDWKINELTTQASTNPSTMAVDASLYKQISANNLAQTCTIPLPTNGVDGSKVIYRFRASATSTLTWNAGFNDLKGALPTSIAINKSLYVGVIYDAFTSTWDVVSVVEQN